MNALCHTVGHSNHALGAFAGLLHKHGVSLVCDVRSQPYSRYNPQFNRETLRDDLAARGVDYAYFGDELGGREAAGKTDYRRIAQSENFASGLARLRRVIAGRRAALMCAEKDPLACHRTILICRALREAPDVEIRHILADGAILSHHDFERRLMQAVRIIPDMFTDEAQCISRAYDKQGEKIAYAAG
jgi:uncharacterized protein (DUF488 family)